MEMQHDHSLENLIRETSVCMDGQFGLLLPNQLFFPSYANCGRWLNYSVDGGSDYDYDSLSFFPYVCYICT